jgi:hypothetical protein
LEEDDTIVVSADKDGLALTTGAKIVREAPQVEDDDDDAAPKASAQAPFGGMAVGNGNGGGGGFL